jgi:hypothetical protein
MASIAKNAKADIIDQLAPPRSNLAEVRIKDIKISYYI